MLLLLLLLMLLRINPFSQDPSFYVGDVGDVGDDISGFYVGNVVSVKNG